jgi:hypothetical protein
MRGQRVLKDFASTVPAVKGLVRIPAMPIIDSGRSRSPTRGHSDHSADETLRSIGPMVSDPLSKCNHPTP